MMTEPPEMSDEEPLAYRADVSANGAGTLEPAPPRRRPRAKHALGGLVIAAVLVGGGLRLVPSGQAAPNTAQGAASTACAAK